MRTLFALLAIVSIVCTRPAAAEDAAPVTIPLREIWGYQLPGTRDVRELQEIPDLPPGKELFERSLIARLAYELGQGVPKEVESGFAVSGVGLDALKHMHDVLVKDRKPSESLPRDRPITIAFFSFTFGQYLRLDSVTRADRIITIKYYFVDHASMDSTAHFALISLGTLSLGDYDVRMERLERQTVDESVFLGPAVVAPDVLDRVVCGPFSFTVK